MSASLKKLYMENENPFKLSLCAGQNSIRNKVTWVYMLEDEYIIPYFHGSELTVTTGSKAADDPSWLMTLVRSLSEQKTAGLIINVGKYVHTIPQEVIDYCNEADFPLFTMPWEISMTEMIQTFCVRIIQRQHESALHDRAMADAIFQRGNEADYRKVLEQYYNLDGNFTVIMICVNSEQEDLQKASEMEDFLLNRVRRFKTSRNLKHVKFGLISQDHYELMVLHNLDPALLPEIGNIILDTYRDAARAQALHMGVGIEVHGISNIHKSYDRAVTAVRMAMYRKETFIRFEDMGFFKILFSVQDKDILHSYANELLGPLEHADVKKHNYVELLRAYVRNDRSLEKTAADLYLHRNTVNYQIQKLKKILHSPLKTAEDLFPYYVALSIRDME